MLSNGYQKYHRLLKACDFAFLKVESKMLSAPWLRIFYCPSCLQTGKTRIGFSITKKVGKAHDRNRLRRILKESFRRSNYKDLGFDILFVVSPNFLKKNSDRVSAEKYLLQSFDQLFKQLASHERHQ